MHRSPDPGFADDGRKDRVAPPCLWRRPQAHRARLRAGAPTPSRIARSDGDHRSPLETGWASVRRRSDLLAAASCRSTSSRAEARSSAALDSPAQCPAIHLGERQGGAAGLFQASLHRSANRSRETGASLARMIARLPHWSRGQRIGLLGGTFNPPHEGHLIISLYALKRLRLDRIWWLVTPGNPLKRNDGLPSLAERLAATRAIARDPRLAVTGFEAEIGARFTADTIAFSRRRAPRVHFVWIMG